MEINDLASVTNEILYMRDAVRAAKRDRHQRRKFGAATPLYAERIWVNPSECLVATSQSISRRKSALVSSGDWDEPHIAIGEVPKIRYCLRHWLDGLSWQEAGAYDHMLKLIEQKSGAVDGVANLAQIKARYAKLDKIFAQVKAEGALQTMAALKDKNFRESGGIYVHIDRSGAPLFGNAGHHRLAIAIALRLENFPAQLGIVHEDALAHLEAYRQRQPSTTCNRKTPGS